MRLYLPNIVTLLTKSAPTCRDYFLVLQRLQPTYTSSDRCGCWLCAASSSRPHSQLLPAGCCRGGSRGRGRGQGPACLLQACIHAVNLQGRAVRHVQACQQQVQACQQQFLIHSYIFTLTYSLLQQIGALLCSMRTDNSKPVRDELT
jgi:hypothetical protein